MKRLKKLKEKIQRMVCKSLFKGKVSKDNIIDIWQIKQQAISDEFEKGYKQGRNELTLQYSEKGIQIEKFVEDYGFLPKL